MVADQEPRRSIRVDLELGMAPEEVGDRRQGSGAGRAERGVQVDDAVLYQQEAARRHEGRVPLQFRAHVTLRMIAVENHHDGPVYRRHGLPDPGDNLVRHRAADEELNPGMGEIGQRSDVDGDEATPPHEVEEIGVEQRRPAAVGAALDDEGGLHFPDCLLDRPQVEDVLPDGPSQPGDAGEVVGRGDERREEQPVHHRVDGRPTVPADSQLFDNRANAPAEHPSPAIGRVRRRCDVRHSNPSSR